jgi:hypothetical protein
VTSFITDGGKFIAWLTGHTHRDYCGKIVRTANGNTINQVVLSAATGGTDASNQDCARVVDEKSQDLFSIYGIDTTRKLIKIYRIGCDCDVWCRHKETACINYETAEVVIDEEAKDNAPEANSKKGVKSGGVYTALAGKQATLVSGTNIKTINNQSLLGSGNITIQGGSGGSGEQSDWNETNTSSLAYIKNKPTIPTVPTNVSAFNNDAGYLNNNFCPIIEDTRTENVAIITGVAPFDTLVDGQRILIHFNRLTYQSGSIQLTLASGTTTNAIAAYTVKYSTANQFRIPTRLTVYDFGKDDYGEFVYDSTNDRWTSIGQIDTNTTYGSITQANIDSGGNTTPSLITSKLFHDNAYIVEETYSSGSLKANKLYDFGTVSSALTIPTLDATNDLVSNALNFYALRFIAGADDLNIIFQQQGVIVDDEPTINTGDYVEIMINLYVINGSNNFYASIKVWQAQQQN